MFDKVALIFRAIVALTIFSLVMAMAVVYLNFRIAQVSQTEAPKQSQADCDYNVTGIWDGDTFYTMKDGAEYTIRIANIDAPEIANKHKGTAAKPGSLEAKAALESQLKNKSVCLIKVANQDRDTYGRLVRDVKIDNENVGQWLVTNNYAKVWNFK